MRCTIHEIIHPKDKSIIVTFEVDKNKMPFEVHFKDYTPYSIGMRKWDYWEINIKWESEVFEDDKTGKKSYFTHLFGYDAKCLNTNYSK